MDRSDLVGLIGDLYKLSPANRDFLEARFVKEASTLDAYKKIVFECLWPQRDGDRFRFREARKAISDYKKASGDEAGEIDLMLHYVETGNAFTCEFGDIDELFYDSVLSMCQKAAQKIRRLSLRKREGYRERMRHLVESSDGIGWGYHDELSEIFCETFPEK
jgi:hypothetical protein